MPTPQEVEAEFRGAMRAGVDSILSAQAEAKHVAATQASEIHALKTEVAVMKDAAGRDNGETERQRDLSEWRDGVDDWRDKMDALRWKITGALIGIPALIETVKALTP